MKTKPTKYRCAACEKMKPNADGKWMLYASTGEYAGDSVRVCKACAAAMKQLRIKEVAKIFYAEDLS